MGTLISWCDRFCAGLTRLQPSPGHICWTGGGWMRKWKSGSSDKQSGRMLLLCLIGNKSLQPDPKSGGNPEIRRVDAVTAACYCPWLFNHMFTYHILVVCHYVPSSDSDSGVPNFCFSRSHNLRSILQALVFHLPRKECHLNVNENCFQSLCSHL